MSEHCIHFIIIIIIIIVIIVIIIIILKTSPQLSCLPSTKDSFY